MGPHDWYGEGVAYLLAHQVDGHWDDSTAPDPVVATSFSLLFLSLGMTP
jgi:hypothetical protein